ncbi:MAG: Ig-like domain-containing protein [Anaerolineae bacterium]
MFAVAARPIRLVLVVLSILVLASLAACDALFGGPAATSKPVVTITAPENGATVGLSERVTVRASAQAVRGIMRVEMRVNDAAVDSLTLFVASSQFDYQKSWTFTAIGQHRVTLVAYDSAGEASDPVTILVNVVAVVPSLTPTPVTPTLTPYVVYVTATSQPAATRTSTPYVVYVTATSHPTVTRTSTPYVLYVTATRPPTPTPTATPWRIYVTATPPTPGK